MRVVNDSGVLILCDPHLTGKSYGRIFLDVLSPMPQTRNIQDVQAFFARLESKKTHLHRRIPEQMSELP